MGSKARRVIHLAAKVDPKGNVSPRCADPPRAIDMDRETWTLVLGFVTCRKCKQAAGWVNSHSTGGAK